MVLKKNLTWCVNLQWRLQESTKGINFVLAAAAAAAAAMLHLLTSSSTSTAKAPLNINKNKSKIVTTQLNRLYIGIWAQIYKTPSIWMRGRRKRRWRRRRRPRSVIKVCILHQKATETRKLRGEKWNTNKATAQNSNTAVSQTSPHTGWFEENCEDGGKRLWYGA